MTTLPAALTITNAADQVTGQQYFEQIRNVISEIPGLQGSTELTISAGSITPTQGIHSVDTEADAASDNLDVIDQSNHPDGRIIALNRENDARAIVVRHAQGGTGQILLKDSVDYTIPVGGWIMLTREGTTWVELFKSETVLAVSSQAQAEAGTDNATAMTPLRVKQAADYYRALASQAEAEAGTNNTKMMTPLRGAQQLDALRPYASASDITTGTSTTKVITPYAIANSGQGRTTGEIAFFMGSAWTGWRILDGSTIGNTGSGATTTGSEYEALFTALWNNFSQTYIPVISGRGASAAADWAALKRMTIFDARGRVLIGAGTGGGLTNRTIGNVGGAETHTLSAAEMPSHTHSYNSPGGTNNIQAGGTSVNGAITGANTGSAGSDGAHNNMQPWIAFNPFIKL